MVKSHSIHHLTFKQRQHIETLLNESQKLCILSMNLNRDPRGIKKEIVNHRQLSVRQNAKNKCGLQIVCKKSRLCNNCESGLCKYCSYAKCSTLCCDFQELPECKTMKRFPYVCNGCDKIKECPLPKVFYKASTAQTEYEFNVSEHKKGPQLNAVQMKQLDKIISDGVKRGIAIEVIIETNHLHIAPSTVYHYIDLNLLEVKNIDLKRKVRYHQRYTIKPKAKPLNYDYLNNRRFDDFTQYLLENPGVNIWQMDTLIGKKGEGENTVLSLLYTKTNLQLFFKLKSNCADEVNRVFERIKKHLGSDLFKEIFECLLTDNGKEFSDPLSIEADSQTGETLTHVFYCNPGRSDQKGKCEKNHEHFRECIPQGISFNPYMHSDIIKISNQVNNYPRKMLGFHSPYESTMSLLNKKVFELNQLHEIPAHKVTLKYPRKV